MVIYAKGPQHDTNMRWGIAEVPLQQGIGKGLIWNNMYWAGHLNSRKKIELEEKQKQSIARIK